MHFGDELRGVKSEGSARGSGRGQSDALLTASALCSYSLRIIQALCITSANVATLLLTTSACSMLLKAWKYCATYVMTERSSGFFASQRSSTSRSCGMPKCS